MHGCFRGWWLAALFLALAALAAPRAARAQPALTTPDQVELPARLVSGLLLVQAEADGHVGTFFFDSGAPALLLNRREFAADPATEPPMAMPGARGVNGSMGSLATYSLRRFACQGLVLENKEVTTLDLNSLEARLGGEKLLGIIGYSMLSAYAVTFDYRAGRVLLRKPVAGEPATTGVRVPFVLRGHLPVVAATIAGQPYQLAFDCGAQTNLLDPVAEAALAGKLRHRETVTMRGADAAGQSATTAEVPRLTLAGGQLTLRHQATTFADVSHLNRTPGREPLQGLLGYPALSAYRTTIDYVNHEVLVERW